MLNIVWHEHCWLVRHNERSSLSLSLTNLMGPFSTFSISTFSRARSTALFELLRPTKFCNPASSTSCPVSKLSSYCTDKKVSPCRDQVRHYYCKVSLPHLSPLLSFEANFTIWVCLSYCPECLPLKNAVREVMEQNAFHYLVHQTALSELSKLSFLYKAEDLASYRGRECIWALWVGEQRKSESPPLHWDQNKLGKHRSRNACTLVQQWIMFHLQSFTVTGLFVQNCLQVLP